MLELFPKVSSAAVDDMQAANSSNLAKKSSVHRSGCISVFFARFPRLAAHFHEISELARSVLNFKRLILLPLALSVAVGSGTISAQSPGGADTITEEDRLGARSDPYSRTFDKAISALVAGDSGKFRALLTPTTVLSETRGPGAIDMVIQDKFIPFFSDFDRLTDSIATMPTFDSAGGTGIAIARSFITKSGAKKSFIIYLIGEDPPKVGNLLLNVTEDYLLKNKGKPATAP
jgi:hypothetical protein